MARRPELTSVGDDGVRRLTLAGAEKLLGEPDRQLAHLHAQTKPIPGRPGWRIDARGRQWYSAVWLDEGVQR